MICVVRCRMRDTFRSGSAGVGYQKGNLRFPLSASRMSAAQGCPPAQIFFTRVYVARVPGVCNSPVSEPPSPLHSGVRFRGAPCVSRGLLFMAQLRRAPAPKVGGLTAQDREALTDASFVKPSASRRFPGLYAKGACVSRRARSDCRLETDRRLLLGGGLAS